ncbi:MAG: hypothetical protein HRT53_03195 [Colwellia sp.]|nr:hypothetical protein [Colwellia sp.]
MELLTSLFTTVILLISPVAVEPTPQVTPIEYTLQICIPLPTSNEEDDECIDPFGL